MKSLKRKWKVVGVSLLAAAMVVVAGCQAIGGIDLNGMLKHVLKLTSYEGKETVELHLELTDEARAGIDPAEAELVNMITDMKIAMDSMKVGGDGSMSASGELTLGDSMNVGFDIRSDGKLISYDVEGFKKPIVLRLDDSFFSSLTGGEADLQSLMPTGEERESLIETGRQAIDIFGGYIIDNMPNPTRLTAEPGQEKIGDDTLTGVHVKAELSGAEVWKWLSAYIDALLNDREGMQEMISGLFDLVESQQGSLGAAAGESIFGSLPEEDQKADAVKEATDSIVDMLNEVKGDMDRVEKDDPESLQTVLNDDTSVKADLFVDAGSLDIRKATIEAVIVPKLDDPAAEGGSTGLTDGTEDDADGGFNYASELESFPFKSISVKVEAELWNVNGDVEPDQPAAPAGSTNFTDLAGMEGYQVLRLMDSGSDLYDLLRNKLHITQQQFALYPDYSLNAPIITPAGITIVPLRDTAEGFGASVTRDPITRAVVLNDDATGVKISVNAGSSNVQVNGETMVWSFPTTVIGGVTYVSARDLAKALGATVSWQPLFEDSDMLVFDREP